MILPNVTDSIWPGLFSFQHCSASRGSVSVVVKN